MSIGDRLAVDIKKDLDLSPLHIDEVEDLPVTAISTENPEALSHFATGLDRLFYQSDWTGAARALYRATTLDSTFVHAQYYLYQVSLFLGQESEQAIQRAMERVLKGRTSFIVAHRLSTIRNSDKIVLLDRGVIAEAGNHDELMALGGRYHGLYTKHMGAGVIAEEEI